MPRVSRGLCIPLVHRSHPIISFQGCTILICFSFDKSRFGAGVCQWRLYLRHDVVVSETPLCCQPLFFLTLILAAQVCRTETCILHNAHLNGTVQCQLIFFHHPPSLPFLSHSLFLFLYLYFYFYLSTCTTSRLPVSALPA